MQDQEKKNLPITSERSAEDIVILYDDGSVKRLDKGIVIYFKDKNPKTDKDGTIGMTFDMLEINSRDLGLIVTSIVQLGLELGMFDGEEDADDE